MAAGVKKYYHDLEGYNGRLDALQAGILQAKLPHLAKWNAQRCERAAEYNLLLAGNEAILLPYEPAWSRAVYHLYVIRISNRDGDGEPSKNARASVQGSTTRFRFHLPPKRRLCIREGTAPEISPVAERAAAEIISLPMFPQLTVQQQVRVAEEIQAFSSKSFAKPAKAEESRLVAEKELHRLPLSPFLKTESQRAFNHEACKAIAPAAEQVRTAPDSFRS